MSVFPQIVEKTANELRPNIIANYAYGLAKQFNEFYHAHNILKEEADALIATTESYADQTMLDCLALQKMVYPPLLT